MVQCSTSASIRAKWCWRLRLVLSVGDRLALTHQQLPHALRLPTQHLYFWRHGVLKKETQSGMPSAGLAITPYKTKNVYAPMDTHRLQTPPPLSEQVCHVRAQRAGVCVCVCAHCAHCARACELYARARTRRTRALHARTVPAHRTRALYANRTRGLYAKSVRQNLPVFFNICCLLLKICCGFSKSAVIFYTCGRHVWWPYGTGRARARTVCTRVRDANCTRGARALYLRTARAHCTYRTRTVRPDCTQKVCAKICCVLFKICCVFFKICCVFFQNLLCFLYVRRARTAAVRHGARARARRVRTCDARALYVPYARTVLADCTEKVCAKFHCCFQNRCVFSISVAFFSILQFSFRTCGPRIWWSYGMARVRAVRTYVRRARARVYGVQRTRAVYVCGARSARVWRA